MAGESARESAERQRAKAERLRRSAVRWEKGADGEEIVGRALDELTASPGWIVLHDQPWPGRQRANLDHVVIGPSGVFVVDAKNWSGAIDVAAEEVKVNGRRRTDAATSMASAAQALVAAVPGLRQEHVRPVVCFVHDEWVQGDVRGVLVCSSQNIVAILKTRPHALDPGAVQRLAAEVRRVLAEPPPEPVTTTPSAAAVVPRVPALRGDRSRGRSRRPRWSALVKATAALAVAAVLALRPETIEPVADFFSDVVVDDNPGSTGEPSGKTNQSGPKQASDKSKNAKSKKQERRSG